MFTLKGLRSAILITPVLTTVLLTTGCNGKEKEEVEVKDYTAISCPSDTNTKLEENVLAQATKYIVFNSPFIAGRFKPHFAQVYVQGKYATGQSETSSKTYGADISEPLRFEGVEVYPIKSTALLELPQKVDKPQLLQFTQPCQLEKAALENTHLADKPVGTFSLMSSRKGFMTYDNYSYKPDASLPVKLTVLNTQTNKVETVTLYMFQILGGDYVAPPSTFMENVQNWFERDEIINNNKWKLNKLSQPILRNKFQVPYFTLTKEEKGQSIPGEILSIEFVLPEGEK